jgi:ribonuclease HI
MYFDGSLNLEGASAGVLLISPTGKQLKYVLQIFWKVSNNEAEYESLLHRLHLAASLGIKLSSPWEGPFHNCKGDRARLLPPPDT